MMYDTSDRLCLSVLNCFSYRLIGISVKSHIGATLIIRKLM